MAPRLDKPEPNVSNETIVGFAVEADRAQRDIDEASGRKRAVLKRAKAAGVKTALLLASLRKKKLEADDMKSDARDAVRYDNLIVPGLKLTQGDLFRTADTKPLSRKAQDAALDWEAESKGYAVGLQGGAMEDAVYAPGTEAYRNFALGYQRGQAVIAERMGEHSKQADASLKKKRGRKAVEADEDEDAEDAAGGLDRMTPVSGTA